MRPCGKKLSLKVEKYLIEQASKKCLGLKKFTCQRPEYGTRSNVKRQNSSRIKRKS